MKSIKIKSIVAIAALGLLSITSCQKKQNPADNETGAAGDHSLAEHISSDIVNIGSQAADNNSGSLNSYKTENAENTLNACATVIRDTTNHIDSVIFNNSACIDGKTRSGILIFNYSASTNGAKHYRDPGFKCTVTSSNYIVDGNQVNIISKTIQNTTPVGFNPTTTNLTWNITSHIQVTKSDGTLDFSANKTKELLNTSDPNVYHGATSAITWNLARIGITGNATGTTVKGDNFTANVTSQLIRDFGACTISGRHPFIQGAIDFTPGSKATRHIDYGNGSCDLNATVTIKGNTYNITLH